MKGILLPSILILGFVMLVAGTKKRRGEDPRGRPFHDGPVGGRMQRHIEEEFKKMFGECKLTPQNSPKVFSCLMKKFKESNMKSQDPKQIFISGMMLIGTSAECSEIATNEQQQCLAGKKKEIREKISEKLKSFQQLLVRIRNACGINETETPTLVKCVAPLRSRLEMMVPQLLDNPDIAGPVWDVMVDVKKCFESKPDIMKCIREQDFKYWMPPPQKGRQNYPKMSIMKKIGMLFEKCGISREKTPDLNECLQPTVQKVIGLFYRRDMDTPTKLKEYKGLQEGAKECFKNTDDEMKKCVRQGSEAVRNSFIQRFPATEKSSGFDPKDAMANMDSMYAGCGITKDKTPALKACLDDITKTVMQLKPWLLMSNETREKLKEEGKKYWKCFQESQSKEQKCMLKIVDGFSRQGKRPDNTKQDIKEFIENIKSEVLACSNNKCFSSNVMESVDKFEAYLEEMQTKGKIGSRRKGNEKLRQAITIETIRALLCLRKEPSRERLETFGCIKKVMNATSGMAKRILKRITEMESKQKPSDESMKEFAKSRRPKKGRRKRATEDGGEEITNPFSSFLGIGEATSNDVSSAIEFKLIFNDQSMERVKELVILVNRFISSCTNWAPVKETLRSREIFDEMKTMPTAGINQDDCDNMYDDINSFIDTGHGKLTLHKSLSIAHHDQKHESSAVVIAVCTGSVVVGILVLLTIIVIFVARHRSQRPVDIPQACAPTATPTICPHVHTTYLGKQISENQMPENQMPPSYSECLEGAKCHQPGTGLSQILSTSPREEGAEKSC